MTPHPFLESRLLAGKNHMAVVEKDRVLDRVLAQTARRPATLRARWWALGGSVAAASALLLFMLWPGAEQQPGFASRGNGERLGFALSCMDAAGESTCRGGSKLLFRTWAPQGQPFFAAFAQGTDGTVIWYAPSQDQAHSVDSRSASAGGVLGHGVHIGPEHRAGAYTVYGLFSADALDKAAVRAQVEAALGQDPAHQSLFRVELQVESSP